MCALAGTAAALLLDPPQMLPLLQYSSCLLPVEAPFPLHRCLCRPRSHLLMLLLLVTVVLCIPVNRSEARCERCPSCTTGDARQSRRRVNRHVLSHN